MKGCCSGFTFGARSFVRSSRSGNCSPGICFGRTRSNVPESASYLAVAFPFSVTLPGRFNLRQRTVISYWLWIVIELRDNEKIMYTDRNIFNLPQEVGFGEEFHLVFIHINITVFYLQCEDTKTHVTNFGLMKAFIGHEIYETTFIL